jgi:2-polyprenyl-6-hydroxyphenyl methylase / 3-demethylubiquinone-9 3-methyltransferase
MQAVTYDVRALEDPAKYDRLVELGSSAAWWELQGPLGGLHLLNEVRVPYFERALGGFAGKRILDIGCGGGIFAEPLAAAGASVVGIDPSEWSLEVAREHAAQQQLEIDYRVAYAETFDTDERFDAVMAVDVLEHVDDVDATLAASARMLKPGGLFGFLTHNQTLEAFELYIWKGEYELGFIPKGNHDFHKFLRPDELSERLAAQGLQTADITGLTFDLDNPHAVLTETTTISYLGYAIKQ